MGDESSRAMKPASREQAVFAEVLQRGTPEDRAAYLDAAPLLRSTVLVAGSGSTWRHQAKPRDA